jgi:hypothetical protein
MLVQNWIQTLRIQWRNRYNTLGGGGKRRRTRVFRSHAVEPVEARLLLSATVTDDSVTGPAGLPITIDVLANDSSSDGASLLITALGEPQMAPWKLD